MKSLSGPLSLVTILLFFIGSSAFAQGYLLVGTTNGSTNGGDDGYGAVYKVKPDGSGLTVIHSFNMVDEPEKGYILNGGVIQGSDKFLYGTTRYGGIHDKGTIFKLRTDGTGFTKLHDFDGAGGADPHPGLIEGEDGTLYGMTTTGGPSGIGVIFKISPSGAGFQVLKGFLFETGGSPRGSLLQASNAVLYGTGFQSGEHDLGSLFSINTDGSEFKVLHHFVDSTGSRPNASLIEGADGRLYGTGGSGGKNNEGVIFRIGLDGLDYEIIFNFNLSDGSLPLSTLLEGSNGYLYGTTFGGGNFVGTLFRIQKDGSDFSTLRHFGSSDDGALPDGGVVEVPGGPLIGITLLGGVNSSGTAFSVDLDGSDYLKLFDFNAYTGSGPRYKLSVIVDEPVVVGINKSVQENDILSPNPVNDFLTISLSTFPHDEDIIVSTFDMSGKKLASFVISGQREYTISVMDYPRGLFIIRAIASKRVVVRKFVKQ